MAWLEQLDAETEAQVNRLLRRTQQHEDAYSGFNSAIKQLWTAIAEMSKDIDALRQEVQQLRVEQGAQRESSATVAPDAKQSMECY